MNIKFFKIKKSLIKDFGIKPDFYWRLILFMTFLLILVSFAFGLYLFNETNKPITPISNAGEKEIIKKERLKEAILYFQEREKKSIQILNSPSSVIDPSL